MSVDLLEPRNTYYKTLKEKHKQKTIEYFDNLTKVSNVDVEANKETIKKYNEVLEEIEIKRQGQKKARTKKALLIILIVILSLIAFFSLGNFASDDGNIVLGIIMITISIGLIVWFIILIKKKYNPLLKAFENTLNELGEKREKLLSEAYKQMMNLNNSFDWNIPATIMNDVTDIIKLDKYFDVSKHKQLIDKFGFPANTRENASCVMVQSGEILGNPFALCKDYNQSWEDHVYTGSITITYTVKTKNGYSTRTQTLTATVTKPAPVYVYDTYLAYGNDAAPKLMFSRQPSNATGKTEKEIDKIVKKKNKVLDKKARDELMDDDDTTNYSRFGNDEFEVLFGGTNRNDELEYRLLFTPLAQKNLISLIKEKEPFGDDFYFAKNKKMNYIRSRHSQVFDYRSDPKSFVGFNYEEMRERFIEYNEKYFLYLFFDFVPLLSIPLYQQTKTREYIYKNDYSYNISTYEDEVLANAFKKELLVHKDSVTNPIIKIKDIIREEGHDRAIVEANTFKTIEHVTYISKFGADGRMHNVPVKWLEYVPLVKETNICIQKREDTRKDFISQVNKKDIKSTLRSFSMKDGYHYERGLFAILSNNGLTNIDIENVNKLFVNKTNDGKIKADVANGLEEDIKQGLEEANKMVDKNISKSNIQEKNNQNSNKQNN